MISLIQMEYLVAVDTYRHFATAAEKCFVTQPTLSMQIKKAEEELGLTVFDRTKQPVVPTDVGSRIIEQARKVLMEAQRIDEVVQDYQNVVSGILKVSVIPTIAPYLIPGFVSLLKREYPGVELQFEELVTDDILQALQKDLIDVGILVTPLNEDGILERPVYYEEMLLYAGPENPISLKQQVAVEELDMNDLWLLKDGHCFRNQVINFCQLNQGGHILERSFQFESGSLETLMRIIDNEGGYTLIPEMAYHCLPDSKKDQVKPFKDGMPLREVSMVYSRNFAKRRLIDLLEDAVKKIVPEDMLDSKRGEIVEWRN